MENTIKLGLGFATGRKSFRKVLNAYIYSWKESGIADKLQAKVSLNLFIAYDLDYSNTQSTDYTNLSQDVVDVFDEVVFLGSRNAQKSVERLISDGTLTEKETKLIFEAGYAGKRNAIVYAALENKMDYLLFLDDDEYPVAVTNNHGDCLWSGQYVLPMHLQHIEDADITNGHHCGYISPIPQIKFSEVLTEPDFRSFIEAISNDVVNWESVKSIMKNGGVTFADTNVLASQESLPVEEINHCKFITGANLCINLRHPERIFPFYNPPGARGEDTFLSTLLADRKVVRIPCYTFHDGFSAYRHLLDGVLPIRLAPIASKSEAIVTRFCNVCIGWVRYKPLLLYITHPDEYEKIIEHTRSVLIDVLPKISSYFGSQAFMEVLHEFDKSAKNVRKHYKNFLITQEAWTKLLKGLDIL